MNPRWTADDSLFFVSDKSDWWNLYEYTFDSESEREVFPVEKEIGMAHWVFARCGYAPHPKNTRILAVVCAGVGIVCIYISMSSKIIRKT